MAVLVAESKAGGLILDGQGPMIPRSWTVVAANKADALVVLRDNTPENVRRGVLYQDHAGNQPYPWALLDALEADPMTEGPTGGTGLYRVDGQYRYPRGRGAQGPPTLPDMVPKYRVERNLSSEPADHDIDGKPIVNSAGQPFDPPVNYLKIERTLVIEWIVFAANWAIANESVMPYEDALNSEVYHGAARGCLLCETIDVAEMDVPGSVMGAGDLFQLTGRFKYRRPIPITEDVSAGGWETVKLNVGTHVKCGESDDGWPVYCPIRLDPDDLNSPVLGFAVPLNADGTGRLPADADPILLRFVHNEYMDFNLLGV